MDTALPEDGVPLVREVVQSIVRCDNIAHCLVEGDTRHPRFTIITSQRSKSQELLQVPEPWVGKIDVRDDSWLGLRASPLRP